MADLNIPYPIPFSLQELALPTLADEQFEDIGEKGRSMVLQLMALAHAQGAAEGRSAQRMIQSVEEIHAARPAERAAKAEQEAAEAASASVLHDDEQDPTGEEEPSGRVEHPEQEEE